MIWDRAEELLNETGLLECISKYGKAFITGSFRMNMMCCATVPWLPQGAYLQADFTRSIITCRGDYYD